MPFDIAKANYPIAFIENLKLTGDFHGKPFTLMPWQRKIIRDVFGTVDELGFRTYRYVYVECAKKNAKSQIGAGIGLCQLYNKAEPNGQIFICAGDREQARTQIYEPLVEMIRQDEELEKRVRITDSLKEIKNKETGTILKVLSAESYTKHGLNVSLCIFDELHVQPTRELYDVMTKGAGLVRQQPLWVFPTTSGDDPDRKSIAWEVHEKALSIIQARRKKGDKSRDISTWYPVIYSYTGDDIWNEKRWKKANPSLGTTIRIEDLRKIAEEAKQSPADERLFRWLNLCQWPTTKLSSWLPFDLWDKARGTWKLYDMQGEDCFLGGDYSTVQDLSSTCLIFPPSEKHSDWRWSWFNYIPEVTLTERVKQDKVPYDIWAQAGWITPTPGHGIDYATIEADILMAKERFNVLEMGADASFATYLLQRLEQAGITYGAIKQNPSELTDPMQYIEILLREGKATHDGNPLVRWAFGNTSIWKNGSGQIKYVKETRGRNVDHTKRIDPIAALVCGMARAKLYDPAANQSVYDTRGLITF
jgi:phage terminase large subunit-like protein